MNLRKERLAIEADAAARNKTLQLRKTIGIIMAVAFVVVGGLGYFLWSKAEETRASAATVAAQQAKIDALLKQADSERQRFAKQQQRIKNEKDDIASQLERAKTSAERDAIRALAKKNREKQHRLEDAKRKAAARLANERKKIRKASNDPLGGL